MEEQKETLHYHHYCTGHGFQKEIDDDMEMCNLCGDYSSIYVFSFDNKEEFIEKYVLDKFEEYYQNDEWTKLKEEILALVDPEDLEYSQKSGSETYDDLIEKYR